LHSCAGSRQSLKPIVNRLAMAGIAPAPRPTHLRLAR
jgi:hypothetical protein